MPGRYPFRELVDLPALQQLTDDLYTATGIPSAIIAMDGEILTGSGWQKACTDFHRKHPDIDRECIASDTAIRQGIGDGEEYVIYECPRGMVDACSPVVIKGEHVANVFAGQLFMSPPDASKEAFFRETARKYGLDEEAYLAAYREIPVLPEEKFRPALRFLAGFAKLVASIGLARRQEREAMGQVVANERKYLRLVESTSTVPWELDLATEAFTYVGPQAEKILEYAPSSWRSLRDWAAALHEEDRDRVVGARRAEAASGRDHELTYRMVTGGGRIVWVEDLATVTSGPAGPERLVGFLRDISERKRYEESLLRGQERLEGLIRTAMDGFWIADPGGRILQVNETYCRMSGYSEQELLTLSISGLEADENTAQTRRRLDRLKASGQDRFEGKHRRRDGTVFDVEVSTQFQEWDGGRFVAFIRDITEKKEAERRRAATEAQLRQAQKMEAVGTLAGGIAHDFNNILGAILGSAELASAALPAGSPEHKYLHGITVASQRAAELVKQILNFSRVGEEDRSAVDLNRVVGEAMGLLRSTIPSTIDFALDSDPGAGFVLADSVQMHQVVMNLCTNAYHAMRERGGTLSVRVHRTEVGAEQASRVDGLRPGDFVRLVIADTGTGMDRATMARIFEPYFTTKGLGEGTGLGLAAVRGIVQSHGGAIQVESAPGAGARFSVYLPRIVQAPVVRGSSEPQAAAGEERILFVDDEPALAELGKAMLESLGYRVREVTDAREALRIFEEDPAAFDVVVTDQTMPGLTGAGLLRKARAIRPELPAVICTGYSDILDENGARVLEIPSFVMKPYTIAVLAAAVRNALASAPRQAAQP